MNAKSGTQEHLALSHILPHISPTQKTAYGIIEELPFHMECFVSEKVNVPSIRRRKLIMEATKKTQNILLVFVLSMESQALLDKQSINHLM